MAHLPSPPPAATDRLLALARSLLKANDLKSVLDLIGPALQELLAVDDGLLRLGLGKKEYVTAFDHKGFLRPADRNGPLCRLARQAMHDRAPAVMTEAVAHPGGERDGGLASLVALPFPAENPVGVLAAFWWGKQPQQELEQRIAILWSIGELIGAAVGNVDFKLMLEAQVSACAEKVVEAAREHAKELQARDRLEEEIRRTSLTDVLTGMLNRRGFFQQAEQSFRVARRQRLLSALIFADVDGLKAVNDELGHEAGDHLIRDSAWIIRSSVRDSDVVARFGGDEFAAFTLDSSQPETILGRLRENIESFHRHSQRPYLVSFSTGIVQCDPSSSLTLSDYLDVADKQMYTQKRGRSRI